MSDVDHKPVKSSGSGPARDGGRWGFVLISAGIALLPLMSYLLAEGVTNTSYYTHLGTSGDLFLFSTFLIAMSLRELLEVRSTEETEEQPVQRIALLAATIVLLLVNTEFYVLRLARSQVNGSRLYTIAGWSSLALSFVLFCYITVWRVFYAAVWRASRGAAIAAQIQQGVESVIRSTLSLGEPLRFGGTMAVTVDGTQIREAEQKVRAEPGARLSLEVTVSETSASATKDYGHFALSGQEPDGPVEFRIRVEGEIGSSTPFASVVRVGVGESGSSHFTFAAGSELSSQTLLVTLTQGQRIAAVQRITLDVAKPKP